MGILCILIPILIGLICALLGYLLGRLIEKRSEVYTRLRADLDACRQENQQLQSENRSLESELAGLSKKPGSRPLNADDASAKVDDASADVELASAKTDTPPVPFDAALAKSAFGKKIVENDLKIVEGIGPGIEGLLRNAGINTWKALSETSVEKCQKILDDAGSRYRIHTPATWPMQAEMAFLGKWKELKKWQDEAIGGKEKI